MDNTKTGDHLTSTFLFHFSFHFFIFFQIYQLNMNFKKTSIVLGHLSLQAK